MGMFVTRDNNRVQLLEKEVARLAEVLAHLEKRIHNLTVKKPAPKAEHNGGANA
jgi:hypothetical protein